MQPTINRSHTAGQVLSISSGAHLVVSVTAVLGAIHHASGPLAPRRLPGKVSPAEMRNAVAVAMAISELIRESELAPREGGGAIEVPEDPAEISYRAGTSLDETESAIALLFAAEVLARVESNSTARVRFVDGMLAEDPTLAQLAWEAIRARLLAGGASLTPALAVVRELARATRVVEPEDGSSWAHLTLAKLSERTLFQRTALSTAIAALESADVVERGQRRGQEGQYRLLPPAFGAGAPARPSEVIAPANETARPTLPPSAGAAPEASPAPPAEMHRDPAGAGVPIRIGDLPVHVPPGMPVSIELDAQGRQYVRIGAHILIGPL